MRGFPCLGILPTWNVNAVLQYLKCLGPTSGLTLKKLTYKLVMLLALTRLSYSADLSSLSLAIGGIFTLKSDFSTCHSGKTVKAEETLCRIFLSMLSS